MCSRVPFGYFMVRKFLFCDPKKYAAELLFRLDITNLTSFQVSSQTDENKMILNFLLYGRFRIFGLLINVFLK